MNDNLQEQWAKDHDHGPGDKCYECGWGCLCKRCGKLGGTDGVYVDGVIGYCVDPCLREAMRETILVESNSKVLNRLQNFTQMFFDSMTKDDTFPPPEPRDAEADRVEAFRSALHDIMSEHGISYLEVEMTMGWDIQRETDDDYIMPTGESEIVRLVTKDHFGANESRYEKGSK
jgi:hypothetical protein